MKARMCNVDKLLLSSDSNHDKINKPCVIAREGQHNDEIVNMKIPALRNIQD